MESRAMANKRREASKSIGFSDILCMVHAVMLAISAILYLVSLSWNWNPGDGEVFGIIALTVGTIRTIYFCYEIEQQNQRKYNENEGDEDGFSTMIIMIISRLGVLIVFIGLNASGASANNRIGFWVMMLCGMELSFILVSYCLVDTEKKRKLRVRWDVANEV